MLSPDRNKHIIQESIQTVWRNHNLAALPNFWRDDCINHAMPATCNRGLAALHAYHEQFLVNFSAFSDIHIEIMQQIAEGDRVVTHLVTRGKHTGLFRNLSPTAKTVVISTIRIDRIQDGKIAEHWSVSDLAGLMQQLQC
jgi:predicted ester cyclase